MGKHDNLIRLRLKLDNAITYGTKKEALCIARIGLAKAKKRRFIGEVEYFKGQADLINNRFVSAIEHFDKAIAHNPYDGASYNDKALCLAELGLIDEALVYFNKGIEVESDYATIYHNKGWLLNNIGQYTQAIACFNKALELEPGRAVTYDNLADAQYNIQDYAGSLASYKRVIYLLKPGSCVQIRKQILSNIKSLEKIVQHNKIK